MMGGGGCSFKSRDEKRYWTERISKGPKYIGIFINVGRLLRTKHFCAFERVGLTERGRREREREWVPKLLLSIAFPTVHWHSASRNNEISRIRGKMHASETPRNLYPTVCAIVLANENSHHCFKRLTNG